jgi:PST family polysaccharide transporter
VVSAFVVARLVGPAELGVGAAAVATHVLLWVGVNALFADAVVQRATLDDIAAASAFWASAAVGVGAAVLQVGAGWPLAGIFGDDRLIGMSLLLAVPLPLVGAAGVIQGRMTRARGYRLLACRALIGQGAGTAMGIGCALAGGGAWAFAAQQATTSAAGAVTLLLGAGWRPALLCRWGPIREMLRVGGPLAVSTMVLHGRYRMFAVLIGGTAGAAALGQVHIAFRLVDTVRELAFTALWRLMLPGMAERQGDPAALRRSVDRWLAMCGVVLFPLCAAMLVTVQPLTRWLLGPAWEASGRAALPLIVLAAWLFLGFPAGVAAVARGAPHYALRGTIASCLTLSLGVLVLRPDDAPTAAMIWLVAQLLVAPYTIWMNGRVLGVRAWESLRSGVPSLLISAVAMIFGLSIPALLGPPHDPAALIAERVLVTFVVCIVGLVILARQGDQAHRRFRLLAFIGVPFR